VRIPIYHLAVLHFNPNSNIKVLPSGPKPALRIPSERLFGVEPRDTLPRYTRQIPQLPTGNFGIWVQGFWPAKITRLEVAEFFRASGQFRCLITNHSSNQCNRLTALTDL
jgi:hypothetical protein